MTYEPEWCRLWCTVTAGEESDSLKEPTMPAKSNTLSRLFSAAKKEKKEKREEPKVKQEARLSLYADRKDVKRKSEPVLVIDVSSDFSFRLLDFQTDLTTGNSGAPRPMRSTPRNPRW